jgi:putative hydrolase of the HAD superfamily
LTPIRLVAFDLDDTLYPERAFVVSGFRVVSDHLLAVGMVDHPLAGDLLAAFDAGVRGRTFNYVLEGCGVEVGETLVRKLVEIYRSHRLPSGARRPEIALYADADQTLTDLRAAGLKTALVSDGPLIAQQAKIEALGLAERLDALILTDAWGPRFWKPHPRAFRELADRFGARPEECLYVADNPAKDFAGPATAGWRPCVRVRRGDGFHREVPLGDPSQVAATMPDLSLLRGFIESLSRSD